MGHPCLMEFFKNNLTMKILLSKSFILIVLSLLCLGLNPISAQRFMENLDRGTVAVQVENGVFISWRILGTEWNGTTYNIYRDGQKLNDHPLNVSNFTDPQGSSNSNYTVTAIHKNIEKQPSAPVTPLSQQYKEIILKSRNTSNYEINDATVADLDGDGEYEIIVKRMNPDWSAGNDSLFTYFEAYKQNGTLLWEINVGPNIMSSSGVEINIAAFDLDADGKAEVFMRTSEGTVFGDGTKIGDVDGDGKTNYRYSVLQTANMQYMQEGPEFLSLIDGQTGAELDRVDFIPRVNSGWWYPEAPTKAYGHRANKFFFGAPYLDGLKPSLFIGRGIYTKTVMRTYDVVNKKLVSRWEWSATSTSDPYYGQGNHNYTIADVDADGRDEIVWGSMAVDDDGTGLYSTRLGHGDAMHVGDLDPFRKGVEAFRCLENSPVHGTVFHDAATGEILIHHAIDKDCGRCCAANISDEIKGVALWGGSKMFSASTREAVGIGGGPENFRIYWDGDLLEEMTDHSGFTSNKGYGTGTIFKYQNGQAAQIFLAAGATSCNYTKGTPSLQADLFGDWREEVVWRREDNRAIRIYTTVDPTTYRNYTLMHDHQYRQAVCWQMCGYNQPPHVSYFLGEAEGLTVPPPPVMTNGRLVFNGGSVWDSSSTNWSKDGSSMAYSNGEHVHFDVLAGNDVSLVLSETVAPEQVTFNSAGSYTLNATSGTLDGTMMLVKQGAGTLNFNGNHTYSGETQIWNGTLNFDGQLQNSPVWLGFFAELNASGKLQNGVTMRYASVLQLGEPDSTGVLTIAQKLKLEEAATIVFDLADVDSPLNDSLKIDGSFEFVPNVVFRIQPKLAVGQSKLAPGDYLLAQVSGEILGDINTIQLDGIDGTPAEIVVSEGNIYLRVRDVREATSIVWNGDKLGSEWDMALTKNFVLNGVADIFVDQDQVTFNDEASSKVVNIPGIVTPSALQIDATSDYIFQGSGKVSGTTTLLKKGSGVLKMNQVNDFTGKVTIEGGVLETALLPNAISYGAIGVASSDPSLFELNGGALLVPSEAISNRALTLGVGGGVIQNNHKLTWNEPIVGGNLEKSGNGNLIFAGVNTFAKSTLKAGTLTLQNDATNPGKMVVFEGGVLQCSDNSSMASANTMSWNMVVAEGQTGTINLDSRGAYTGTLTGAGSLVVNIPFVRSDLNGDWSAFSGAITFNSTYSNSQGYSAELRLNNSKGLPKAHVTINSKVTTSNVSGNSLILGALSGVGTLSGDESYQIGAKGIDSEFAGAITAGSLTKVGAGVLTLSGASTYAGTTTVSKGTLHVSNTTGSATGTGALSVQNTATLTGTGSIGNVVNVETGGTLKPGKDNVGTKLTLTNSLNLKAGSTLKIQVNPLFKLTNKVVVSKNANLAGKLVIENVSSSAFKEGDRLQIIECNQISGAFTSIEPATPGEGLIWDFSELATAGVVKVDKFVSVQQLSEASIRLYPNPIQNAFTIEVFPELLGTEWTLVDLSGRVYLAGQLTGIQNKIEVETLERGVYFIQFKQNETLWIEKLIKK